MTCYVAGVDVEWPLMKVVITFIFCCNNLWKSKFMALERPGKLRGFFLLLCGHPDEAFCGTVIKVLCKHFASLFCGRGFHQYLGL